MWRYCYKCHRKLRPFWDSPKDTPNILGLTMPSGTTIRVELCDECCTELHRRYEDARLKVNEEFYKEFTK